MASKCPVNSAARARPEGKIARLNEMTDKG